MNISRYDKNMAVKEAGEDGLVWYRPHEKPFRLVGFNWFDQDRVYRRFPVKPSWPLPSSVDALSWCTAGGQVKFRTDSAKIVVKVTLRDAGAMDHMPQTGMSGFDLYVGEPGKETFFAVTRFACGATSFKSELFSGTAGCTRNFTLNFPLYKGVNEIQIGLQAGAKVQAPPAYRSNKPVVVYGTSITQGGCASRPGACYTNILSRQLNRPFINLGFSGSGRGEPDVARLIASINTPALLVLDYEANCETTESFAKTLPEFIEILRASHRKVPILVISRVRFAKEVLDGTQVLDQRRDIQRKLVARLRKAGDRHIRFLDGSNLLGRDYWECSVDGVHPTDLGFFRMAAGIEPVITRLLA